MFQNICLVFFAIPNTCKTRTRTDVKKTSNNTDKSGTFYLGKPQDA